jgi:uncharacterized repeat protein (TIGR01451 family)
LRISNAYAPPSTNHPPEYELQTYSKPTKDPAGQKLADTVFTAQFSFISVHPDRQQPGLNIDVSPDNGRGSRMSFIGLTDTPDGIQVTFWDTPGSQGFVAYDLGTLARNVPHTIRFWIRLVPGPDNDLVRISIDGQDAGQCFTTWENAYDEPTPSDRLLFRVPNKDGDRLSLLGGGYLFDNVTTTTAPGNGPPTCDLPIEKKADSSTVRAGGLAGYQIGVRNRGTMAARNVRLCDHIPRHTTFAGASRKLSRIGSQRCLLIPQLAPGQRAGFHIDLRVDANAPQGTLTNIADITPGELPFTPGERPSTPGETPSSPGSVDDLPAPLASPQAIEAIKKRVKARVKVLVERAGPRREQHPRFTG